VSGAETAAILAEASGRRIAYEDIPLDVLRAANDDWPKMFEWFSRKGYKFHAAWLRSKHPEVRWRTLREWAGEQDWSMLSAAAAASPGAEPMQD
jgi:hypothetical protein